MNLSQFLERQSSKFIFAGAATSLMALGFIDYITGPEMAFSIFYLFPIWVVAWYVGPRAGLLIAVVAAVVWFLADAAAGGSYVYPATPYWNATIRLGTFMIVVFLLTKLKDSNTHLEEKVRERTALLKAEIDERKRLESSLEGAIHELEVSLANIKTLHGLLPICAWCKKIRDDHGYWKQVEVYVMDHSEADFTHGICPECAEKHRHKMISSHQIPSVDIESH